MDESNYLLLGLLMLIITGLFTYLCMRIIRQLQKKHIGLFRELLKVQPLENILPDTMVITNFSLYAVLPRKMLKLIGCKVDMNQIPVAVLCELKKMSLYLCIASICMLVLCLYIQPHIKSTEETPKDKAMTLAIAARALRHL